MPGVDRSRRRVEVTGQQSNHSVKARLARLHTSITQPDQRIHVRSDRTRDAVRQKQRRLSPSQVRELIVAYGNAVPINTLATQFQIHRSTVLDHVSRASTRRRYPALRPSDVEEAAELYRAGQALRTIGVLFGVHASTVGQYLIRAGLQLRDCQGRER